MTAACVGGAPCHLECIKKLPVHAAHPESGSEKYGSALQAASLRGHTACLKEMLSWTRDVDGVGGPYHTALQAACWAGSLECVKLLLKHGNPNVFGGLYGSPLQAALASQCDSRDEARYNTPSGSQRSATI